MPESVRHFRATVLIAATRTDALTQMVSVRPAAPKGLGHSGARNPETSGNVGAGGNLAGFEKPPPL